MPLTPVQESLIALTWLQNQITAATKSLVVGVGIKDEDVKFTSGNHLQILLCSFLQEWGRLEGLAKKDHALDVTVQTLRPAVNEIRKWTGLFKVRSSLLAHNLRDRAGNLVWPWEVFEKNQAPTNFAEMILLGNCARIAARAMLSRHSQECKEAARNVPAQKKPIEHTGIARDNEIKPKLDEIRARMRGKARELGIELPDE